MDGHAGTPRLARRARERVRGARRPMIPVMFRQRTGGPHIARSVCRRLTFNARHTKSPRALSRPRTLKRLKPRTSLTIGCFGQPLALRVALPARGRGQLLNQRCRVRVRIPVHRPLALAPRRYVPVDAARFERRQVPFIAVAGIRKHCLGLFVEGLLDLVEQPRSLVACIGRQLCRNNQLMLAPPPAHCSIAGTPRRRSS